MGVSLRVSCLEGEITKKVSRRTLVACCVGRYRLKRDGRVDDEVYRGRDIRLDLR